MYLLGKDPPASASQVIGLKPCVAIPGLFFYFNTDEWNLDELV